MLIIIGIIVVLFVIGSFKAGWDEQKSYDNINKMAKMMEKKEKENKYKKK